MGAHKAGQSLALASGLAPGPAAPTPTPLQKREIYTELLGPHLPMPVTWKGVCQGPVEEGLWLQNTQTSNPVPASVLIPRGLHPFPWLTWLLPHLIIKTDLSHCWPSPPVLIFHLRLP